MKDWTLDGRLEGCSLLMASIGLCQLRLMNDRRWPWILLVPQRDGITELFDMTPLDQTMLTFEMGLAGKAVKEATGCLKLNVGTLGNQVRQLHIHIIARNEGDPGWPGPVWGHGTAEAYDAAEAKRLIAAILDRL